MVIDEIENLRSAEKQNEMKGMGKKRWNMGIGNTNVQLTANRKKATAIVLRKVLFECLRTK